jgi:hypothetical protein
VNKKNAKKKSASLSDFQTIATRSVMALLAIFFLSSCNRDEENIISDPADEEIIQFGPEGYLVSSTNLGIVPVSLVKLTAQLAGYPQFNKYMKYSIDLYKIVYRTTYKGEPILASGIFSYPVNISDSLPVMVVGNGLIFADEDAPSEFHLPNNYTGFEFIATMGYFTLIPDMIGFGTSKDLLFPIHNYEHSAKPVVDFIFASEEFIARKRIAVNKKMFLTGYSQGGYIALATLKMIEENPSYGIKINATAIGAGGFNLANILNSSLANGRYPAPSHLVLLLSSYNIMYEWNRPMTDFFQEPYAHSIPGLISGKYNRQEIEANLVSDFENLLTPKFYYDLKNNNERALINAMVENSIDNWAPKGKLKIIHSVNDDIIPVSDSRETYKNMIAKGSQDVSLEIIETEGHVNSGFEFVDIAFQWFKRQQ